VTRRARACWRSPGQGDVRPDRRDLRPAEFGDDAGLHHEWRRRAADLAEVSPGGRVLDVATGTGDLALELAGRVAPGGQVIAVDFSERMLELARQKATAAGREGVQLEFRTGTRWRCPLATVNSTPSRWASASATSPISIRVCER